MSIHINEEEALLWTKISHCLKEAHDAVAQARVVLMLDLHVEEGRPLDVICNAENALSGLSYLFHPQQEWTGGDSSDPKNFKIRKPHIARTDK